MFAFLIIAVWLALSPRGGLGELLEDDDDENSSKVMKALLQMDKLDIEILTWV